MIHSRQHNHHNFRRLLARLSLNRIKFCINVIRLSFGYRKSLKSNFLHLLQCCVKAIKLRIIGKGVRVQAANSLIERKHRFVHLLHLPTSLRKCLKRFLAMSALRFKNSSICFPLCTVIFFYHVVAQCSPLLIVNLSAVRNKAKRIFKCHMRCFRKPHEVISRNISYCLAMEMHKVAAIMLSPFFISNFLKMMQSLRSHPIITTNVTNKCHCKCTDKIRGVRGWRSAFKQFHIT